MGAAMSGAFKEMRAIVGITVHSDNEERAEDEDEDKRIMGESRRNYWKLKRTDSDGTNYERAGGDGETSINSRRAEKLL